MDGLSPLLFFSLGLLHRLFDMVAVEHQRVYFRLWHLRLLEYVITATFICPSIGFSGLTAEEVENEIQHHPKTSRAAGARYVVGLAGIVLSSAIIAVHHRSIAGMGQRTLYILVLSLPVLFCAYAVLGA